MCVISYKLYVTNRTNIANGDYGYYDFPNSEVFANIKMALVKFLCNLALR